MSEVQLRVHDLWKTFDPGLFEASVEVLKGLSVEVEKGEIFGFLGAHRFYFGKPVSGTIWPPASSMIRLTGNVWGRLPTSASWITLTVCCSGENR